MKFAMRVEEVKLTNFRGFGRTVSIRLNSLTAFIGKNDVGKSTVLEALDIFFNGIEAIRKISEADVNRLVRKTDDEKIDIEIACVFSDVAGSVVLDEAVPTTLAGEQMLREDGRLEVVRVYPNGGKPKTYVDAFTVVGTKKQGLLALKNADLANLVKNLRIRGANLSSNVSMRAALRKRFLRDENRVQRRILLSEEIAGRLFGYLPRYEVFLADRENTDRDPEAQDPIKAAVRRVCERCEIKTKLDEIGDLVRRELSDVMCSVREKTGDFDRELMDSLTAVFPSNSELKWCDVFKPVTFEDANKVPLNKRGSGVKRMVLMGLMRTFVEREMAGSSKRGVIYAIEEPETGQHADNQEKIVTTLLNLSLQDNAQVLMTSHSAVILRRIPADHVRFMRKDRGFSSLDPSKRKIEQPVLTDSIAEASYLLFGECAVEYHNELYGLFTALHKWKEYEDHFIKGKDDRLRRTWDRDDGQEPFGPQPCSLSYYIRNKIHHPENTKNGDKYTDSELRLSIQTMRSYIQEHHLKVRDHTEETNA